MTYYLIKNLVKNGQCDYKGLDLTQIIGGTQVYPYEQFKDNRCLLASYEDFNSHEDLIKITEDEYLKLKTEILANKPTGGNPVEEETNVVKELAETKLENIQLKNISEQTVKELSETKLKIMELENKINALGGK